MFILSSSLPSFKSSSFLLLLSFYSLLLLKVECQTILSSRMNAECSLIQNTIYCYGGLSNTSTTTLREHYSLDMTQFNGFTSTIGQSKLQWNQLSTQLDQNTSLPLFSNDASAPIQSNKSYVLYSTFTNQSDESLIQNQFLNYYPQTNQWSLLPTMTNYTNINVRSMLNLGNDNIWVWAGPTSNNSASSFSSVLGIYNYNGRVWTRQDKLDWYVRIGHTATLAKNGMIYIIGGSVYDDQINNLVNFTEMITYNTQSNQWANLTATIVGRLPSGRAYHTTINLPDKDILLIYGGNNLNYSVSESMEQDVLYTYNTVSNKLQSISMPSGYLNARYGHFATIYNYNFLVLIFGFSDQNVGADTLNVLNIANLNQPYWTLPPVRYTKKNKDGASPSDDNVIKMTMGIAAGIMGIIILILTCVKYHRRKHKKALRNNVQEDVSDVFEVKEKHNHYPSDHSSDDTKLSFEKK
ncbi:unnamed protein product [Cunninghamella blakesleeana]